MAEEKNEFEKTKELTQDELMNVINTDYGVKLKMNDVKAGHHVLMKILAPVAIKSYAYGGAEKQSHNIKCFYESPEIEGFELLVQVGEGAAERLKERYPNDSYVGMYAFFSRTLYQGNYPQFINPIPDYSKPKNKDELFAKKATAKETIAAAAQGTAKLDLSGFDEFKGQYIAKMKGNNMVPNPTHMVGSFMGYQEGERIAELIEKCKDALK